MAPPSLSKDSLAKAMGLIDDTTKIPLSISLEASKFLANGHPILTEVPSNITTTTPSSADKLTKTETPSLQGCFVGFRSESPSSHHVVPLGKLKGIRFMSIFRFKVWWTTHWTGTSGNDVEHETQMLLLENSDYGRPYVLLLPLLEGPFRASLQPGPLKDDHVAVCMESGSTQVCSSHFKACLYMHVGNDPFTLVKDAMKVVSSHLGTFKLLEEKSLPGIVDKFGWCTWDAFYLRVDPNGIWEGVKGLVESGCPPGLVLIDDGWQSICQDDESFTEADQGVSRTVAGEQMPCRLIKFEENYKFKNYQSLKSGSCSRKGMGGFIRELKEEFKCVEYVYVWHALCGYWGGIRPNVPGLPCSKLVQPKLSKGLQMTMEDLAVDKIVENGVGLVPPDVVHELYEGLHSHLASVGIDGVKIDVIHLLEMLCEEYGGRIELAKAFYKALTASVRKHFDGNGVIASMQQCNDFMFLGTETISLGRAGDDFWCTDPSGDPNGLYWLQGCHMVHCAYNSLWLGNFIQPDWDMFQSTHPCAAFHAASRAISGGPIYVSDMVGNHNIELLKSLVLPDGSILRCQTYALPTKDCLFENPLHDGKTMLKIWNLNKYTGVIGAFNCQGGGWCPESRRNRSFSHHCNTITCMTSPKDIEWSRVKHPIRIKGVDIFAVYMHKENQLKLVKAADKLEISLDPFDFNLLTFSPVSVLPVKSVQFAPIGLVNMLNAGGAIQSMAYDHDEDIVKIEIRGTGEMKVFSSEKPTACKIGGADAEFSYKDSLVSVQVPWQDPGVSVVEYLF